MRSREIFFNFLSSVRQRKAAAVVEAAAHARLKKFNARTPLEGEEGGGGEHSSRPRERGFFVSDDKYISKHTRNGLERRRVAATTTGDWPICETRATRVATHLFAVPELDYYNTFTNYALPCRGRTQARFFPPSHQAKMSPRKRSNGRCRERTTTLSVCFRRAEFEEFEEWKRYALYKF